MGKDRLFNKEHRDKWILVWKNINPIPTYTKFKTKQIKSLHVKNRTFKLPKLKIKSLSIQGRKALPKQNPKSNTKKENIDNFNYIKTSIKLKTPKQSIKIRHLLQEDTYNTSTKQRIHPECVNNPYK